MREENNSFLMCSFFRKCYSLYNSFGTFDSYVYLRICSLLRDVHGSDRTLVGSDENYRLSENPTIRSEVSNSRLNNIHIADMLLTDKSEVKLIIIYLTINQEKT